MSYHAKWFLKFELETSLLNLTAFNPNTKANRREYWVITPMAIALSLILLSFCAKAYPALAEQTPDPELVKKIMPALLLGFVTGALNFYLFIVTQLRRLNDVGHSKLWFLLNFVPFLGLIFFLYLGFAAGKQDTQRVSTA